MHGQWRWQVSDYSDRERTKLIERHWKSDPFSPLTDAAPALWLNPGHVGAVQTQGTAQIKLPNGKTVYRAMEIVRVS